MRTDVIVVVVERAKDSEVVNVREIDDETDPDAIFDEELDTDGVIVCVFDELFVDGRLLERDHVPAWLPVTVLDVVVDTDISLESDRDWEVTLRLIDACHVDEMEIVFVPVVLRDPVLGYVGDVDRELDNRFVGDGESVVLRDRRLVSDSVGVSDAVSRGELEPVRDTVCA